MALVYEGQDTPTGLAESSNLSLLTVQLAGNYVYSRLL